MKMIGEYTCRGQIPINTTERIHLFDGSFKTAYRIVEFSITPANVAGNFDAYGKIKTEDDGTQGKGNEWNWDDQTEVAWGYYAGVQSAGADTYGSWVDPDNLIVEDAYIRAGTGTETQDVNYMIKFEKYDISEYRGALSMVRNRSQA